MPIFSVMFVMAFVVEPSVGVALVFAIAEMGRSGAGVVFDAIPKLDGRIFGEVVLPTVTNTAPLHKFADFTSMAGHCLGVSD
jgi:hypothetical protein